MILEWIYLPILEDSSISPVRASLFLDLTLDTGNSTSLVVVVPFWTPPSFSNSAMEMAGATVASWNSSFSCSFSWILFLVWMTFCWTVSRSMTGWIVSWRWLWGVRWVADEQLSCTYWWTCSCSLAGTYSFDLVVSWTFFSSWILAASSWALILASLLRWSISSSNSFSL